MQQGNADDEGSWDSVEVRAREMDIVLSVSVNTRK